MSLESSIDIPEANTCSIHSLPYLYISSTKKTLMCEICCQDQMSLGIMDFVFIKDELQD